MNPERLAEIRADLDEHSDWDNRGPIIRELWDALIATQAELGSRREQAARDFDEIRQHWRERDRLASQVTLLEPELTMALSEYKRTAAALDATCRVEEALREQYQNAGWREEELIKERDRLVSQVADLIAAITELIATGTGLNDYVEARRKARILCCRLGSLAEQPSTVERCPVCNGLKHSGVPSNCAAPTFHAGGSHRDE